MNENCKLLFIDDDEDFINGLTPFLRKDGCDIYSATDGKSGLEMIQQVNPDIILLDVVLPDSDGFELCRIIKRNPKTANLHVILVSGLKISSDQQAEGLETGADGYMIKSMSAREMRARLKIFIQNKQNEKALQNSEARYRGLLTSLETGVVVHAPDTSITFCNARASELLGLTYDQLLGKVAIDDAWKFIYEDNSRVPLHEYPVVRIIKSRSPIRNMLMGVCRPDSDVTWLMVNGFPVLDTKGFIIEIIINFVDITGLKQAEETLRQNRNMLDNILNTIPQSVFWKDRNSLYLGCNRPFALTAGLMNPGEIIGKSDFDLPWVEEANGYREDDRFVMANNIPKAHILETLQRKDGSRIWIDTTKMPLLDGAGKVYGVLGVYEDITERKLAEDERSLFYNTLSSSLNEIYIFDALSLKFLFVNRGALKNMQFRLEEMQQMTPLDIKPELSEADFMHLIAPLQNGEKELQNFETVHRRADGTVYPVDVHLQLFAKEQVFLAVIQDITERKNTEIQLKIAKEKAEESEIRLKQAQKISKAGTYDWNIKENTYYWSEEFLQIFGMPKDTVAGFEAWKKALHPDDLEIATQRIQESIVHHAELINEYRVILPNNEVHWIRATGRTFYENDTPVRMIGLCMDITDRLQLENEREKFILLADSSSEFIGMCTLEMIPIYVNPAGIRMVGLADLTAACSKQVQDYFFPEDQAFMRDEFFPQVLRDGHGEIEIRFRHFHTGEPVWMFFYLFSLLDASGKAVGWATVSRNITDRKRADEETRLSEVRLRSLVNIQQYHANSIQELLDFALEESLKLTGSKIGYIYFYDETSREFTLNTWSGGVMEQCAITEQQTIYQLEKTGLWGEAVRQRKPIIVNEFEQPHPLKKGYPEGHAPLSRFLTIPVFNDNKIIAVVGQGNKVEPYMEKDVLQLSLLMNSVWKVVERMQAEEQIKNQLDELLRWQDMMLDREDRVQELKREVNALCMAVGKPSPYPSQEHEPEPNQE